MKKIFSMFAILAISVSGFAQNVDNFEVGPYEVDYKGAGDYKFRLRKGVDLYEYFGLKKDTVINVVDEKPTRFKHGVQLSVFAETCMSRQARYSMVYGIGASWKQRIANKFLFNGGLSLGFAGATTANQKYNVLEIGIPLSVEWSNLNAKKASFYAGLGMTPTIYATTSAEYITSPIGVSPEKYNGFYIAPCLEVGAYVPVGKKIMKIGITWRQKINCSTKNYDLYQQIIGRTFVGANLGIIL